LPLKFATPDSVWPVDFVMSPSHVVAHPVKFSLADKLVKTVAVLDPTISPSRVLSMLNTIKGPDVARSWKWCLIHGCSAHGSWECPCINQIFPRRAGNS
jgi:hypothetical protein